MSYDIVLAGVGGQGIQLASRVLMTEAVGRGVPVKGSETHGMAQRGGSVAAHVRIGPCHSSLVLPGAAELLIALEPAEGLRNLRFVGKGTTLLLNTSNSSFIPEKTAALLERRGATAVTLDATRLATELGQPRAVNTMMLGFAAGQPGVPFTLDGLNGAVDELIAPAYRAANRQALEVGYGAAMGSAG